MAYSLHDTTLVSALALVAATLLVCVRRIRRPTATGSVVVHAGVLGVIAPVVVLGVVGMTELEDSAWRGQPGRMAIVLLPSVVAIVTALVMLRDVVSLVAVHRAARLARGATPPTAPLSEEAPAFDFGIGDQLLAIERVAEQPYRKATRAHRAFFGDVGRAVGVVRRAWLVELLAVAALAGVALIASREPPLAKAIVTELPRVPVTPEAESTVVWSAPFAGDARLAGNDDRRGHAVVALSNFGTAAAWSLVTVDVASGTSTSWEAGPAQAKLWTGLHTGDGFHAVDGAFETDLLRYASVFAVAGADAEHAGPAAIAVSADAIVYPKHDTEDAPTELWIADRDGHGGRRLDTQHVGSARPAFSPTHTELAWIAWTERVAAEGYLLVVAHADGSDARIAMRDVADFGWTAGGRLIAHTMEHDRECIAAVDGGLHHCIAGAKLGTLIWDRRRISVAWVGFGGPPQSSGVAWEWIRLATGEVLAHGAIAGGNTYADALLDSTERPAVYLVAGRGSPATLALERIDLPSGRVDEVVSNFQPGASGRGDLAWDDDEHLLYIDRPNLETVRLTRLRLRLR